MYTSEIIRTSHRGANAATHSVIVDNLLLGKRYHSTEIWGTCGLIAGGCADVSALDSFLQSSTRVTLPISVNDIEGVSCFRVVSSNPPRRPSASRCCLRRRL